MRLFISSFLFILFTVFNNQLMYSQSQSSMVLGGIELSLGMQKEIVLKQLRQYQLDSLSSDSWDVSLKKSIHGKNESIGGVHFRNNKLFSIDRNWGQANDIQTAELFSKLFAALNTIANKPQPSAMIHTYVLDEPEASSKYIAITINGRLFHISIDSIIGYVGHVRISESIDAQ